MALSAIGAGSLPVHGTVSAGPETNRLAPSKIRCTSPRDLDNRRHRSTVQRPASSRSLGLGKNRSKPRNGVAGSVRSYAPPSWETTVRPHRSHVDSLLGKVLSGHTGQPSQPLGKSTFRPHPSTVCSLLGKPAAERPRRPGFPATNGTRSAVFGAAPRPGQPARGAPDRCRGDDVDEQARKVHLPGPVPTASATSVIRSCMPFVAMLNRKRACADGNGSMARTREAPSVEGQGEKTGVCSNVHKRTAPAVRCERRDLLSTRPARKGEDFSVGRIVLNIQAIPDASCRDIDSRSVSALPAAKDDFSQNSPSTPQSDQQAQESGFPRRCVCPEFRLQEQGAVNRARPSTRLPPQRRSRGRQETFRGRWRSSAFPRPSVSSRRGHRSRSSAASRTSCPCRRRPGPPLAMPTCRWGLRRRMHCSANASS